jgi:hypothetical protein
MAKEVSPRAVVAYRGLMSCVLCCNTTLLLLLLLPPPPLLLLLLLLLLLVHVRRMCAAVAALFQDVSVRFLEERTERALQRCAADTKGEQLLIHIHISKWMSISMDVHIDNYKDNGCPYQ